ncbi:hypothetical protein N8654_01905 [Synechococcus sp. AH-601-B19]|nr:hypothetical protein [Synechococcus sp. AH-601-B19]
MLTTSALTNAMEAVLTELGTHCRVISLAALEMDERLAVRQNLADGVVRGLVVISIHQKMLELQMDGFFLGARGQLVDG